MTHCGNVARQKKYCLGRHRLDVAMLLGHSAITMSFRVQLPEGVVVEAQTIEELSQVLALVRNGYAPAAPTSRRAAAPADASVPVGPEEVRRAIRAFSVNLTRPSQVQFIARLLASEAPVEASDLCTAAGIDGNLALGGLLRGLGLRAEEVGLTLGAIVEKGTQHTKHGRVLLYGLTREARAALTPEASEGTPVRRIVMT